MPRLATLPNATRYHDPRMCRLVASLAWLCAGCLSTPPELLGDGGADDHDAADHDAGPDDGCGRDPRPATACHAITDFTAVPYAPGASFVLRQGKVDDVNADGQADLLIVENTAGSESVYVLLGPVDPAAPEYHARIDTDLEAGEVEVRQVLGALDCPDLVLFGRTPGVPGVGAVQIWRYDGGGGVMYPGPPLTADIPFEPDVAGVPTLLAWARLHDGGDDLLVADIDQLAIVHVDGDVAAVDDAPVRAVAHRLEPPTPSWDSINGLDPSPTLDCARDRVFVAENRHGHFLVDDQGDGTGEFEGGPEAAIPGGNPVTLGTARIDLDGALPDDILIGGTSEHGAYLLSHAGGEVAVTVAAGDLGYSPVGPDFYLDGFAIGQLGGGASPEWVGVDYEPGSQEPRAILIDGMNLDGTTLVGAAPQIFTAFPSGFVPRAVVIADLLGAGANQAWVMSTDGRLSCLRRRTTVAALEACP
jgi:hypothetical protein